MMRSNNSLLLLPLLVFIFGAQATEDDEMGVFLSRDGELTLNTITLNCSSSKMSALKWERTVTKRRLAIDRQIQLVQGRCMKGALPFDTEVEELNNIEEKLNYQNSPSFDSLATYLLGAEAPTIGFFDISYYSQKPKIIPTCEQLESTITKTKIIKGRQNLSCQKSNFHLKTFAFDFCQKIKKLNNCLNRQFVRCSNMDLLKANKSNCQMNLGKSRKEKLLKLAKSGHHKQYYILNKVTK
jgi:hypothetical protein